MGASMIFYVFLISLPIYFQFIKSVLSSNGERITVSPYDVLIRELQNQDIVVASGRVDHSSRLYRLASFEPSPVFSFIAHVDSLSRIWHEKFGHLKYMYLQKLSSQKLIHRLPKFSCTNGLCLRSVLRKQHQYNFPKGKYLCDTTPCELVHIDLMIFPTRSL